MNNGILLDIRNIFFHTVHGLLPLDLKLSMWPTDENQKMPLKCAVDTKQKYNILECLNLFLYAHDSGFPQISYDARIIVQLIIQSFVMAGSSVTSII